MHGRGRVGAAPGARRRWLSKGIGDSSPVFRFESDSAGPAERGKRVDAPLSTGKILSFGQNPPPFRVPTAAASHYNHE